MTENIGSELLGEIRRTAARAEGRGIRFFTSVTGYDEVSYGELDADARSRAVGLWAGGLVPGDVALLAFEPGLAFIRALMGCLYAGLVATPVPVTAMRNADAVRQRLVAIAQDSGARVLLTAPGALAPIGVEDGTLVGGAPIVLVDGPATADADLWQMPDIDESALALLQYTSGSTGVPKGVMVSHGNLVANQRAIRGVVGTSSENVTVGWLPHYHDMGLIGQILQPIFVGAAAHLMSPSQFLRRPVQWLRLMSEVRATHTVGPDFAFALCTRIVTEEQLAELDLSSIEAIITGAEPVRIQTMDAFTERFGAAGFRGEAFVPAFGMAETTLLVTGHRAATPPEAIVVSAEGLERDALVPPADGDRTVSLVPCGTPALGMEVAIVDPASSTRVAPGRVGEIWARGTSVAQGYWRRPDETRAEFGATLLDEPGGPYLRTGDLGALVGGELVITGRIKDLIIIRGRNIYPQDLELAAAGLLSPGCLSAAFELPGGSTEIGLVAEIESAASAQEGARALSALLRREVSAEFTLPSLGVALIRKGTLPRTTSGKVQRGLTRRLLAEQRLPVVHAEGFEAARA